MKNRHRRPMTRNGRWFCASVKFENRVEVIGIYTADLTNLFRETWKHVCRKWWLLRRVPHVTLWFRDWCTPMRSARIIYALLSYLIQIQIGIRSIYNAFVEKITSQRTSNVVIYCKNSQLDHKHNSTATRMYLLLRLRKGNRQPFEVVRVQIVWCTRNGVNRWVSTHCGGVTTRCFACLLLNLVSCD